MITFRHKGDYSKATQYFMKLKEVTRLRILEKYGRAGVAALASATPVESGATAGAWYYEIENGGDSAAIVFGNTHENKGVYIAIILQMGHGTGTGGYVQGRDYINPSIQPIFDKMAEEVWREVTKL